jgi:hypothetical protein
VSCTYNQNHLPQRECEWVNGVPTYCGTAARRIAQQHDLFWRNEISQGLAEYEDARREPRWRVEFIDTGAPRAWTSESGQWMLPIITVTDQPVRRHAPQARRTDRQPGRRSCPSWHRSYNREYNWSSVYGASNPPAGG